MTTNRDKAAARRILERGINLHGVPEKISIDKSGSSTAAIENVKTDACVDIAMRQSTYLNNIVEQDHTAVKRVTQKHQGRACGQGRDISCRLEAQSKNTINPDQHSSFLATLEAAVNATAHSLVPALARGPTAADDAVAGLAAGVL